MFFLIAAFPKAPQVIVRVQETPEQTETEETFLVAISQSTTCADVVDSLRPKLENDQVFYLTQIVKDSERVTTPEERLFHLIEQCPEEHRATTFFRLRACHLSSPTDEKKGENLERTSRPIQESKPTSPEPSHRGSRPPSGMAITKGDSEARRPEPRATAKSPPPRAPDSGELTVEELRQISARQQRHIEQQRMRLAERTSRLQQLRRRDASRKSGSPETEAVTAKLRTRIEECEATILQTVTSRTQVNECRFSNENMALELDSLKTTFAEKQRELSRYSQRVEELKAALEKLRSAVPPNFEGSGKEPNSSNGLLRAVNAELKAKFGLSESDDAKELGRRMEERRAENQRLDEQLVLLRKRLGRPEAVTERAPPSLPSPMQPKPPRPPPPPRSTSPLRPPRLQALSAGRGLVSSSLEQLGRPEAVGPRPSRYAPRSVIADTYMRRLRPGRTASLTALSGSARPSMFPKTEAPAPTPPPLALKLELPAVVKTTDPPADTSANDSGRGPSLASSTSAGGQQDEGLEDDVFANGTPVPPPAAFEGEISSSSANTTPTTTHDYSSDSLSIGSADQGPRRPPDASVRPTKSCLKSPDSGTDMSWVKSSGEQPPARAAVTPIRNGMKQSVSFDPLALMLDAAMEGELALVRTTARQVPDVSASNDEGTTALHNAVCCGHDVVSRFLVIEAQADVNASDIDGWTPLHCAACCGNLPMAQLLVEHGAAVFLRTNMDLETALEKCEEEAEGGQRTAEYLFCIQQQLGIVNNGVVYAAFPYEAKNPDELSFKVNEALTVLKKGDAAEMEWYWTRNESGATGYIPRNFVALRPRSIRPKDSLLSPMSPTASKGVTTTSTTPASADIANCAAVTATSATKPPSTSSAGSVDERSDKTAF